MLTSAAVDDLMKACLFREDEPTDDAVRVEGIVNDYGFHPERVRENADKISTLLAELPDEFQREKGGGWTFLNACLDKHGNQWTGLHQQQERLFALGIAAGKARWMLPRRMWSAMPGGMPYVQVN